MDRATISMQYFTKVPHFTLALLVALLTSYSGRMCAQAQQVAPAPLSGGFAVSHIDSASAALTRRGPKTLVQPNSKENHTAG
jgi:hypothetical protein